MLKKIVIAGSAAAVVLGAGTAALAASGSTTPSAPGSSNGSSAAGSSAAGSSAAGKGAAKAAHGKKSELRRSLHAQWVTRDGKNKTTFVTHDAIRGQVTAVSATSITVKSLDNVSQTYVLNSSTKVHTKADGKGKAGTLSELHTGDRVVVAGTGTSSLTATQVLDAGKK